MTFAAVKTADMEDIILIREPKTARGRKTLRKILDAACIEFGQKGYHDASVTSITSRAEVAQGTFYIYFETKEDLFRALVIDQGRLLRDHLTATVSDTADRITAERDGLEAFILFVREHPELYRIIMEAQFVDEAVYRLYFCSFAEAYVNRLQAAAEAGDIADEDLEERAWAIMGMSLFLGLKYGVWDKEKLARDVADRVITMIEPGLRKGK